MRFRRDGFRGPADEVRAPYRVPPVETVTTNPRQPRRVASHDVNSKPGPVDDSVDPMPAGPWPTGDQELLLRAALWRNPSALEAWRRWKGTHSLMGSDLDSHSARLLPLVYKNLSAVGIDEPWMGALKGLYRYWWCANQDLFHRAAALLEQLGVDT